jgi:hypothetical protein
MAVVVLLAGLGDAISTVVGLHHGAHELNPLAVALAERLSLVPVLVLRVVPPAFGAFLLVRWARRDRVVLGAAVAALGLVVVGWMVVAANNVNVVQ